MFRSLLFRCVVCFARFFFGVWCVSLAPLASFSGVWCSWLARFFFGAFRSLRSLLFQVYGVVGSLRSLLFGAFRSLRSLLFQVYGVVGSLASFSGVWCVLFASFSVCVWLAPLASFFACECVFGSLRSLASFRCVALAPLASFFACECVFGSVSVSGLSTPDGLVVGRLVTIGAPLPLSFASCCCLSVCVCPPTAAVSCVV